MQITGTIEYVNLSGGFYGITGDDGQKYQPDKPLPSRFCEKGLRIKATILPSSGFSVFMWGKMVKISDIHKFSSGEKIKKI